MNIYNAHPATREYLGAGQADPDPLQPDNWLIPAHAYVDAPPIAPAGYSVRRVEDGSKWELVEDHRGTVYSTHTGAERRVDELGPVPDGFSTEPRPSEFHNWSAGAWVLDAAAARAQLIQSERDWRNSQIEGIKWLRDRHRDQVDIAVETTLTVEQFTELLVYVQALRDWPQSDAFPDSTHRPMAPPWIADQTQ